MKIFRTTLLFIFITLVGVQSQSAEKVSFLRVKIDRVEDLIPLIEKDISFLDVRIRDNAGHLPLKKKIDWISDNGFVTIEGNSKTAAQLAAMGYEILATGLADGHKPTFAPEMTLPDQFGWPKTMAGWPGIYGQATTVDDMNGEGRPEIFLNNIEGYIYGWRYNGTYVPSYQRNPYQRFVGIDPQTGDSVFATWASTGSQETGAIGDIDGDGMKEFVFGKDIGYLFAYPYGPGMAGDFPLDLGLAYFSNAPAMYDLDDDGKDEIVLASYLWPSGSATYGPADVHIFNEDGTELEGWPNQIPVNSESSPVIGDIDGDFQMEIVVGSGRDINTGIPGRIYAWNLDGSLCSGFPIEVGNSVESTPSLVDIDLNGIVDILIRVSMLSTGVNGVYAFNGQGQLLAGFPAVIPRGGTKGAPAVADMDGDGLPEIAIGTALAVDSGMVYVYNYDGSLRTGFPMLVNATWVEESVVMGDVSGDGLPDVIATTNGLSNDPGKVWAFDHQGNVVSGFPLITDDVIGSSLESTPTIYDVDGDGDTEIFTANWDGKVFCWDSPGIPTPGNDWPMFKYDARRTGNNSLTITGIAHDPGNVPVNHELTYNYPNPFNPSTNIVFTLGRREPVTIRVFTILGEEITTLVDGEIFPAGRQSVRFDGSGLTSGLYIYEVQADNSRQRGKMMLLK